MDHIEMTIVRFCRALGVSHRFSRTAKGHPKVVVYYHGVCAVVVFPTAGDRSRTAKNVCAQLRSKLGLRGVSWRPKRGPRPLRAPKRERVVRAPFARFLPAPPRPHDDYRSTLAALAAKMQARSC
jgi:hypothetical protein